MRPYKEIAVLIPHYNDYKGLKKSILSIKESEPIDVFIVDDGSSYNLIDEEDLIKSVKNCIRLNFLYLDHNQGIENALNKGLKEIVEQGFSYIARLDCGDYCVPERFAIQRNFLEENHEIAMVGSFVNFVDEKRRFLYKLKLPVQDTQIRKKMFLNAMFIHPAIMFRRQVVEEIGYYPITYEAAEDYAFFFKIIKKFKVKNIPEVLVECEINSTGISGKKRKQQVRSRTRLIKENFYFGFYPVYGLLRNLVLLVLPRDLTTALKKVTKRIGL